MRTSSTSRLAHPAVWAAMGLALVLQTLPATLAAAQVPSAGPAINELRIDQDGTDIDEYVELVGEAGAPLGDLTLLVLGDGAPAAGSGVIESVVRLTGAIGADGLFLVGESTMTIGVPDQVATLNFENGDNVTHLLVESFAGSNGADLDVDDDGTLDATPWGRVVDGLALLQSTSAGERVYAEPRLGPDGTFVPGHVYACPDGGDAYRIGPFGIAGGHDSAGTPNPCGGEDPSPTGCDVPPPALTAISCVQGTGAASPLEGQRVSVQGVLTTVIERADAPDGFFLQEQVPDADPATSEGVLVFCRGACPQDLAVGDVRTVTGTVEEFFGMTQVSVALGGGTVQRVGVGAALPVPSPVELPAAGSTAAPATFESLEGMHVSFPDELVVSEYFQLARYGEIVLTDGARPFQHTHTSAPDVAGFAASQADLATRRIILDDLDNDQNEAISSPTDEPYPYPEGGLAIDNRLRGGDTITGLSGVMHWSFAGQTGTDAWRIRPIPSVHYTFDPANPAPAAPTAVGGRLRVASFNVLNYFTTIDATASGSVGTCGPSGTLDCRGADSAAELDRQRRKIVDALVAVDADVIGLVEIQNDDDHAVSDLVSALNDRLGAGTYDHIATGTIGADAIKVALIYTPSTVQPMGSPAVLDGTVDPRFDDTRNRPTLVQSFTEVAGGGVVTVAVNHLKSKGSSCSADGDPDLMDGQGNCNATRTAAAEALVDFLEGDPTGGGDAVLVLGDLNAYRNEDPVRALVDGGYTDLVRRFVGEEAYSFVFDGQLGYLDHALASPGLLPFVTGAAEWHVNADEVPLFDYNDAVRDPGESSFERESAARELFLADARRSSDHDPVVVGLDLPTRPVADAGGPYEVRVGRSIPLDASASGDLDGDALDIRWDYDGDGAFDDAAGVQPTYRAVGPPGCRVVSVAVDDGTTTVIDHARLDVLSNGGGNDGRPPGRLDDCADA